MIGTFLPIYVPTEAGQDVFRRNANAILLIPVVSSLIDIDQIQRTDALQVLYILIPVGFHGPLTGHKLRKSGLHVDVQLGIDIRGIKALILGQEQAGATPALHHMGPQIIPDTHLLAVEGGIAVSNIRTPGGVEACIGILDETLAYQVDNIKTVLPYDTSLLGVYSGEDYCTLVTCTPYGVNTHRLLVRGTRIPYKEAEVIVEEIQQEEQPRSNWEEKYMLGIWLGILVDLIVALIVIICLIIRNNSRARRRRRGSKYAKK